MPTSASRSEAALFPGHGAGMICPLRPLPACQDGGMHSSCTVHVRARGPGLLGVVAGSRGPVILRACSLFRSDSGPMVSMCFGPTEARCAYRHPYRSPRKSFTWHGWTSLASFRYPSRRGTSMQVLYAGPRARDRIYTKHLNERASDCDAHSTRALGDRQVAACSGIDAGCPPPLKMHRRIRRSSDPCVHGFKATRRPSRLDLPEARSSP